MGGEGGVLGFGGEEADDGPWGSWFRRRSVPKGCCFRMSVGGYYFGRPQGCTFGQRGDPGGVTLEEGVLGALV